MTMKFFTPARWLRFQGTSGREDFRDASEDWEKARSAYQREVKQIRRKLPSRLRRFAEEECLHDAVILAVWQGRSRLKFLLRLDSPSTDVVELTYTLMAPLTINPSAIPNEYRSNQASWMYDEIGIEKAKAGKPAFTHTILLSNGWEITIRFNRFDFLRRKALLPNGDKESVVTVGTPKAT
jgi:hypothetical protein